MDALPPKYRTQKTRNTNRTPRGREGRDLDAPASRSSLAKFAGLIFPGIGPYEKRGETRSDDKDDVGATNA